MKKQYCQPQIIKTIIDSEINMVLMSVECPPVDPETLMMMEESEQTDGGIFTQFINPMKWFK